MSTRLTWEFSEVRDNFASFGVTWQKLGGESLMSHVIENGVRTDVLVVKLRTPIMYRHLMTRDTPRYVRFEFKILFIVSRQFDLAYFHRNKVNLKNFDYQFALQYDQARNFTSSICTALGPNLKICYFDYHCNTAKLKKLKVRFALH